MKEVNKNFIWKIQLIHLGWIIQSPTPHTDVQKWRDLEAVGERRGEGMVCATVVRVRGM